MRVLILGGYGVFGGRLARLLKDDPGLTLIIAGRSLAKAEALCLSLGAGEPAALDRDGDVRSALAALAPRIVVDASGPFQRYGGEPYRVAQAAIDAGAHYLDLADDTAFVCGIDVLDASAKTAGVFVMSGASTFPALSSAAVRALSQDMDRLDAISAGVSPSPYAGVGLSVIRAIASYAGQPVRLRRGGADAVGYGLVESRRCVIAPPGALPLRPVHFSLVDVPDLQLAPRAWPQLRDVWAGAGPVPEVLHWGLNALALLVRWRLAPTLSPLAGLFHRVINTLRWGEHRGGMFVAALGHRAGRPVRRSWSLVAEGDDGPLIPSMAAAALIQRTQSGEKPNAGARPASDDLQLTDFAPLFAVRRIQHGIRDDDEGGPVFRRVLGPAFDALPTAIQVLHDGDEGSPLRWPG